MPSSQWKCAPLIMFAAVMLGLSAPADAGAKKGASETKVKATATATKPDADGKQTVTITLDVLKGWHIHANPVRNKDYEMLRTLVSIAAREKVAAQMTYPPGKYHIDAGIETYIYEDRVVIIALVQRTPGDASPLRISIDVNACNTNTCLDKGTITITVP